MGNAWNKKWLVVGSFSEANKVLLEDIGSRKAPEERGQKKGNMKTSKIAITALVTIVASVAITASAFDTIPNSRAKSSTVVVSNGATNPNLLLGLPVPNSRAQSSPIIASSGVKNPNLLAFTKCGMTPKAKDTAACKKHCDVAAAK
jgi:hypothetical protein